MQTIQTNHLQITSKQLMTGFAVICVYLTISLACDPIAFRLISVFGVPVGGSAFLYAALYPLLDILTRIFGKRTSLRLVVIFHLCDFLFTYSLFWLNLLPVPHTFHALADYTRVISPMPRMFWAGIIGALAAGIIEILIYSFLQGKIRSFFYSSSIATFLILLFHNVPTEFFAFHIIYPKIYPQIIAMNFAIGVILLLVTSFILNLVITKILPELKPCLKK